MTRHSIPVLALALLATSASLGASEAKPVVWYAHPADKWENALPIGNGRLGAMVFGRTDEEEIQLNEETLWSGGPYSTTVPGGYQALPEIRRLLFDGQLVRAHRLFGRHLMGYPVEQQKYQSLGGLILKLDGSGEVSDYRHELDLDTAVATTSYARGGVRFKREAFVSPVDQVLVVRLSADAPGAISFVAQLRGARNQAHSNYATDYFQMDGHGTDGLVVRGKSADYLGVAGKLRYEARLRASPRGGELRVDDDRLVVRQADEVTLRLAAATSFVSYKDVSADPAARVDAVLRAVADKPFEQARAEHVREHQRLFRRVALRLGTTPNSTLPTDERLAKFDGTNDPDLAALVFQFGRYLLIASSRPGTQPANLQGIWNKDQNPMWDSKYTTNINTQMNYWPAEVANLSECAEPLFQMIRELTDQGRDVARENYGARGWVFHQNTDLWRVAAPMDGPNWGGFTTGGAWLATHLWEHYLFTGDLAFLRESYPVLKGSAEFFLDFLVPHPKHGWLVTNPSTSPENFPLAPGNEPFFDEVTGSIEPGDGTRGRVGDRHADPERPLRLRGRGRRGARDRRGVPRDGCWRRAGGSRRCRWERRATCRNGSTTGASGRRATAISRACGVFSRDIRSRRAGRRSSPTPRVSSSSSAACRATAGRLRGRRPAGRGSATPRGRWTTSTTPSTTTRPGACSRSAPRRCRWTARSG